MRYFKIALISIFILIFISACVFINQEKAPKKGFIEDLTTSKNSMLSYVDKKELALLAQKIKEHRDLKIRIYGDSHMAADFFSRELRKIFIKVNAIGFVYPLQPKYQQALTLNYQYKNFELLNSKSDTYENYPMGGIVAKAINKGAFIRLQSNLNTQKFNVAFLFKSMQKTPSFKIEDAKGKSFILKTELTNKWTLKEFKDINFPIQITALEKDVALGGYFIKNEKDNVILDTLGVNGARSDLWTKWDIDIFEDELKLIQSDLNILAYGSNDALFGVFDKDKFKNNYKNFIKILRKNNPNTSILLISPPTVTQKKDEVYVLNENFYNIRQAIYELAKEEKTLLFDMHNFMENTGSKNTWIENNLSLQDVHLSISGYELMADKFYKDLKEVVGF
ncbi:hypothetical protein DMB92_03780 [Campylobacter sp. MIT 99-7217]|uniref:GDSL-type esterase/lipase family protein n=1 Tax=Campylobacter sp. MIT 99-7217 TaxID=535091 RepID=UPI00115B6CC3|nr:GDSL-type esterase/lipase family protein [Campylobacter sp. MIT 99-7217]TQR33087.1 hypothetical protein DMB92_03780 [Campylobacter sp. MIT 99-7217]